MARGRRRDRGRRTCHPHARRDRPAELPWAELGVDVVIESTGRFRTRAAAAKHLEAGAAQGDHLGAGEGRRSLRTQPSCSASTSTRSMTPTRHHVISNASCTTNCLAPVAKVLHEAVGIKHGLMTTVHAYTADQNLLDGPHSDLRRARSAAINLVPDVDRRREGARLGDSRARGPPARLRGPRAAADRVAGRPDRRGRAADDQGGDQRRVRASGATAARSLASSPTPRIRSSPPTSSSRPTRRSSTPG